MTDTDINDYAEAHSSPESDILKKLNRETNVNVPFPRMLAGNMQGKLLQMISCMLRPKKILEVGTYTGYSALCLSEGLAENGILHTIEINPEREDVIRKYIAEAGLTKKINLHIGNALDIIPAINGPFELVFIDADKENYLKYYHSIFDKVRKGGFILADNALWGGKVLKESSPSDTETIAIKEFNRYILNDKRVKNLLLPFRDGLMIIRKISGSL